MTDSLQALPRKVLVANRGEIAIRIFRTLRDLGIASVAVYSDADRDAQHIGFADEAWRIGGETATDSYLRADIVLDIADRCGADALHPGYGFLAENASFAHDCAARGITFIGPSPDAITAMGTKTESRRIMQAAGVTVVPGVVHAVESLDDAHGVADGIGYPVAVKARSGGGGRGFRVALTEAELPAAFEGASGEGERYFSDAAVYLERYLHDPRHIEVQILADRHGNAIHLGERDCTIQRRHQKLVEESPAPTISDAQRAQLVEIALGAVRATNYTNAGTIECLVDSATGECFFLEMNTRIQVEHSVTELVTGIDIVAEQLNIAAGNPLSISQDEVHLTGHAIECRVNAEDALAGFQPQSGSIVSYREPAGPGVRVDSGYSAGSTVSMFYDNLIAKVITWGADREQARMRMLRALSEFSITGVTTLIPFYRQLLVHGEFVTAGSCRSAVEDPGSMSQAAGASAQAAGAHTHDQATIAVPLRTPTVTTGAFGSAVVEVDGKRFAVSVVEDPVPVPRNMHARSGTANDREIAAPIPGNVVSLSVAAGDAVSSGQVVCVLEAMKMENEIHVAADGVVSEVFVQSGDSVAAGDMLLTLA